MNRPILGELPLVLFSASLLALGVFYFNLMAWFLPQGWLLYSFGLFGTFVLVRFTLFFGMALEERILGFCHPVLPSWVLRASSFIRLRSSPLVSSCYLMLTFRSLYHWLAGGRRSSLRIGFGGPVLMDFPSQVVLEPDCVLEADSRIFTFCEKDCGWHRVHIGEGAWVGPRATIMPGVRIGRGAIIGGDSLIGKNAVIEGGAVVPPLSDVPEGSRISKSLSGNPFCSESS